MKEDLLQWFTSLLIKSIVEVVLLLLNQIISLQINSIDKSLENLRSEKFIHILETMFGIFIKLICNH